MDWLTELLPKVKLNLILSHDADDALLQTFIASAIAYAQSFQHLPDDHYTCHAMPPTTEHAIIILSTFFYESRDGSTAGFFGDNVQASQQVWNTVNSLLRLDRVWCV
ncbi:hypothetical protein FACS1894184_03290 [Clostridia bacterium]|nr:hypothetical protein FACS1894184_03290 [Clostridia bacterium]